MALITLPEGQQRSGKQGGIVFSHNRGGPYVRTRAIPTNPNTDRQVDVRNILRALAIVWNTVLTQVQRDAWDLYAANVTWLNKLGQTISLTGLNHFIRSNTPRLQGGLARIDTAPVIFDIAEAELELGCTASEATQLLSVSFDDAADWCSEDGAAQFMYMGIPQNASRKYFGGPWRALTPIEGDSVAPPASPVSPAVAFPVAEGQRVWLRTRIGRADGRLSEFAQVNFLVAA